jgi:hypothetical protein
MTRKKRLTKKPNRLTRSGEFVLVLALVATLAGCNGASSSSNTQGNGSVSGNWQFKMGAPADNSFQGGIQGGFLLQNGTSVSGAIVYSVFLPAQQPGTSATLCNSGTAPVTGTINGSNVTLNTTAGPQTFTLTGTLSADGSTLIGTYSSTDGAGCGTKQDALSWSALLVPPITGTLQGNFHSVLSVLNPGSNSNLRNQDFAVTGTLTQGQNIGASNATVTGTLTFQGYPCAQSVSVNGQISGTSVLLHLIGSNGLSVGQIGAPTGFVNPSPVNVASSTGGTVLQGSDGYAISTGACPGGTLAGDIGDVCLALGNSNSCTQPILLSPPSLSFPLQLVGSAPTTQTITLTNSALSGTAMSGFSIAFSPQSGATSPFGLSDFDGLANFTEQDNCSTTPGGAFSLAPQQSCSITVAFSPQQSCPWMPSVSLGGEPPLDCPFPLSATLTVNSPASVDSNTAFAVPISGYGFSAIIPSTPELDFGSEALGETSAAQSLSFTNQSLNPVQILPPLNTPCTNPAKGVLTLPRPITTGAVAGLQVVTGAIAAVPANSTVNYFCDSDLTSKLPNFQIVADDCSGTLLMPQTSCNLQVAYVPQPSTPAIPSLDYFLELNTLQCTSSVTANCELDSGRFPVEITANVPSPLRMSPGAGLDFGTVPKGVLSNPLAITLFNDPKDPNAQTINFTGNLMKGDYTETDNCGASLAPGSSCTINVTFQPKIVGSDPGSMTITYTVGQLQVVHLRGTGE